VAWRANGDYYSLSEDMIRLHAPSAPGVYGLYNLKYQILIDSSANIQAALLRHVAKTRFHFRRFMPTGFVFEICPADLRESRAQELIREYNPILQTSRPFAALWHSWIFPNVTAFYPQDVTAKQAAGGEVKQNSGKVRPKAKQLRSGREQFAVVATGFGVILAVVGLVILFARLKNNPNIPSQTASLAKHPSFDIKGEPQPVSLATAEIRSPLEPLSGDEIFAPSRKPVAPRRANAAAERPKAEIFVASEPANHDSTGGENKTALPAIQQKAAEKSERAKKEGDRNGWAVQAVATTDKRIAVDWLEKLKAKGYEPFLIKAELKGQTWYRVRAGHFHTRAEAEALRSALQLQEGLEDAFVAPATKSETVIALSPP
jgi:cell division septation protein DedD